MVKLQPVVLVHFVCIERDRWGIDPSMIIEEKMYNLTHLSGGLSTPNPGLVDEKVCTRLHYFDLLGEADNDSWHTLYLG